MAALAKPTQDLLVITLGFADMFSLLLFRRVLERGTHGFLMIRYFRNRGLLTITCVAVGCTLVQRILQFHQVVHTPCTLRFSDRVQKWCLLMVA